MPVAAVTMAIAVTAAAAFLIVRVIFAVTAAVAVLAVVASALAFAAAFAVMFMAAAFLAFFAAAAASAAMTVPVRMAVRVAAHGSSCFGIALERLGDAGRRSFVGIAADPSDELDPRRSKRRCSAFADAAADDAVHLVFDKGRHLRRMALPRRFNESGSGDRSVFYRIDLEGGRHAEMLEDGVVLDRNCNFHDGLSFVVRIYCDGLGERSVFPAASSGAVPGAFAAANLVAAPADQKPLPVDDGISELEAGPLINFSHRRARNAHLHRALLVRALLEVDDSNRFVLFDKKIDDLVSAASKRFRRKGAAFGFSADASRTTRSRHSGLLLNAASSTAVHPWIFVLRGCQRTACFRHMSIMLRPLRFKCKNEKPRRSGAEASL